MWELPCGVCIAMKNILLSSISISDCPYTLSFFLQLCLYFWRLFSVSFHPAVLLSWKRSQANSQSAGTCLHNACFPTTEVVRGRRTGAWFCIHSIYFEPPGLKTSIICVLLCARVSACVFVQLITTHFCRCYPRCKHYGTTNPGASHMRVSSKVTERLLTLSNSLSGVQWMFKQDWSEIAYLVGKAFMRLKIPYPGIVMREKNQQSMC